MCSLWTYLTLRTLELKWLVQVFIKIKTRQFTLQFMANAPTHPVLYELGPVDGFLLLKVGFFSEPLLRETAFSGVRVSCSVPADTLDGTR